MADAGWILLLSDAPTSSERLIGGKAQSLARLRLVGFHVPDGFCITTSAYQHFLTAGSLVDLISMELGRKPLDTMRWEEIWDAALRIRSGFLTQPVPTRLQQAIVQALASLGEGTPVAVRSSAPGEDTAERSFAGLHESIVGVSGSEAVLDAVRTVWASLWSDAALLYRQELALDPFESRMAVLVQTLVNTTPSGVAFARDPRDTSRPHMIVEAVPGPCSDLVDGLVDPDRWVLARDGGEVLSYRRGDRDEDPGAAPLLTERDLSNIHGALGKIERQFGWPPDMEWTGPRPAFTVLQARPITTRHDEPADKREWYLTLRPGMKRMQQLRLRVADDLIPKLEALGQQLASEPIETYEDTELAGAIEARVDLVKRWKEIYWDEFIPFAHGVRQLGTYYNDTVKPEDPYEFVRLLQGERMLATRRNERMADLAAMLRRNESLRQHAQGCLSLTDRSTGDAAGLLACLKDNTEAQAFLEKFSKLLSDDLDTSYKGERLSRHPGRILRNLYQMSTGTGSVREQVGAAENRFTSQADLERKLLDAVGPNRQAEAQEVIATARLSWRLRDDDNILVGRLEAQLLRAVRLGAMRLSAAGRLGENTRTTQADAPLVARALRRPTGGVITLPEHDAPAAGDDVPAAGETPRQLIGQPASPGLATGRARTIRSAEDLGRFQAGEVLVCDAIEPTMTHLVPLASAVVERRGGMLIHGAIIARELGIPCVNGVARAADILGDGEILTVDGYLGIVTVGPPEFNLEIQHS